MTIELVLPSSELPTVRVNCYDTVHGDQLIAMNRIVVSCLTCRYQLWNFSRVERLVASTGDVEQLARQAGAIPTWSALESIIMVGQLESVQSLAMSFKRFALTWQGPRRYRELLTFANLDEASNWIDGRPSIAKAASPRVYGRSLAANDREKRVGIPPVPPYVDYYLNDAQNAALERFQRIGWQVAFVRRLAYQKPLLVMTNPQRSDFAALKGDGSVTGSIKLVVRESDLCGGTGRTPLGPGIPKL